MRQGYSKDRHDSVEDGVIVHLQIQEWLRVIVIPRSLHHPRGNIESNETENSGRARRYKGGSAESEKERGGIDDNNARV